MSLPSTTLQVGTSPPSPTGTASSDTLCDFELLTPSNNSDLTSPAAARKCSNAVAKYECDLPESGSDWSDLDFAIIDRTKVSNFNIFKTDSCIASTTVVPLSLPLLILPTTGSTRLASLESVVTKEVAPVEVAFATRASTPAVAAVNAVQRTLPIVDIGTACNILKEASPLASHAATALANEDCP